MFFFHMCAHYYTYILCPPHYLLCEKVPFLPLFIFPYCLCFLNHSPPFFFHRNQGTRLWVEGVGCVGRAVGASAGLLSRWGGSTGWQLGGKALLKIHCWESHENSAWLKHNHTQQEGLVEKKK